MSPYGDASWAWPAPESWHWRRPEPWGGRVDDPEDPAARRWHEAALRWDGSPPERPAAGAKKRAWLIGCPTDIGVGRNKGRRGAAAGPRALRRALANLPARFASGLELVDAGDIEPAGDDLEGLSEGLSRLVRAVAASGGFPIVLGGGHEIAYGVHRGLEAAARDLGLASPEVLSLDAHLDLRPAGPPGTPLNSGNMWSLIASERQARGGSLSYAVAGIQRSANTDSLFARARDLGAEVLLARDAVRDGALAAFVAARLGRGAPVHATLCVDVIDAAHAPAVSAPQPFGLSPTLVLEVLRSVALSGRALGLDVAEVAPRYDGDAGTASLVAVMLYAFVNALAGVD